VIAQKTIRQTICVTGVGLHSGEPVTLRMVPAAVGTGIVFLRNDLDRAVPIEARYDRVVDTRLCTVIGRDGATVSTVEHIMSALYGIGIDNLVIDLDGPEVPILDGSASVWVREIEAVGTVSQRRAKSVVVVKRAIEARLGDAYARLEPSSRFRVTANIDFDHPLISRQEFTFDFGHTSFVEQIARARTFAFKREVDTLRANGLALGGSLDNAIVIDDFNILNPDGLRYADEFVRHKILDAIGDLALVGEQVVGHLILHRSGHALNNLLVRELLSDARNFRRVVASEPETLPAIGVEWPVWQPAA
jgi:UDP-3-O-[3-hydroxymyristoyl] N-acetylglucosamine deacetylase